jgi:hypothetical protein
VHCAECGKPFHVEEGSEVIQVARPANWPNRLRAAIRDKVLSEVMQAARPARWSLRPRFGFRRKRRGCLWIIPVFAGVLMIIFASSIVLYHGMHIPQTTIKKMGPPPKPPPVTGAVKKHP